MTDLEIIDLLSEAIEIVGDGGPTPFTYDQYMEMYNFLNRLREQY